MKKLLKSFFLILAILTTNTVLSQSNNVSGVVTASDDLQPLMGVNVIVSGGGGMGTITDMNGRYSMEVPAGRDLIFRYVGYQESVVAIPRSGVYNVVLVPDARLLDEVVAIGYGSMRKSDLTGSVASIRAEALQRTPAAGLDQALQGRAAGVTVNTNTGQPGAQAEIRIRGIGTVNNSAPIFVVDGTIVENITFLSPNDIESTEILKDASATAIYGSRGANGVILVTTKKGRAGQSVISLNTYYGVQNRWRKLDLMQSDEFANTLIALNNVASERLYFRNNGFNKWLNVYRLGRSPYFPLVKTETNPTGLDYENIETDWQDAVFNPNATIQNYHLSVSGGTDKSNYVISGSYFNQEGTVIGSHFDRLTLRINTSFQVRSWLRIGENLSFMSSSGRNAMNNNASPGASILSAALAMAPWDPTHYPAGSVNINGRDLSGQIAASSNFRNVTNPFSMVENTVPSNRVERWVGDIFAELTPIEHLVFRTSMSMDLSNNQDKMFRYAYEYSSFDRADKNFISSSMARYSTLIFENILTYQRDFNKHSLTLMGGQTTQEFNYNFIGGAGASILNPTPNNWFLSQATTDRTFANDGASRTRMFSLLSRAHYSFDSRYMITVNFRADASSKFPENIWGYFPSMAMAWRVSDESWMKGIPNLDFMKVRAGWGQIGNDKISADNFILKMFNAGPTFVDYVLGANQNLSTGAAVLTFVNKGGKWETTEQWSAGIDFGFFNGLLAGSFDLFQRDTKEMLLSVKAPAHVGNRFDPVANVGQVRNKGVELSLEHQNRIGRVNYNVSANVSVVSNELTSLNGGDRVYGLKSISDEGFPLFTLWGYKYEGIFQSDEEALSYLHAYNAQSIPFRAGDAKFADLNKDGKIDDNDRTDIGNPFPWLTYGLNLGADYAGFDMQLFLQGVGGNELYNAVRYRTEGRGVEATLGTQMRNLWSLANPTGNIPNPYGSSLNFATSSRFVESGSYLRLKNVQIGYTLPRHILEGTFVSKCRFYVSANNLLTFTAYTGYDPEVGGGVDFGNYPQARTILFGVNLEF